MSKLATLHPGAGPAHALLYSARDAIRFLRLPTRAPWGTDGLYRLHYDATYHNKLQARASFDVLPSGRLSFNDLVSVFLRSADPVFWDYARLTRAPENAYRADYEAELVLQPVYKIDPALLDAPDVVEQLAPRRALYRDRVEYDGAVPIRLFPFTRARVDAAAPRLIAVDPRRGFGNPVIASRSVRVDAVASRFRAGESVADLADDYGVTATEVEEAARYDAGPVP